MFLLFFALNRIMNLEATSSVMESNVAFDFYKFHDAITQLQFNEQIIKTVDQHIVTWVSLFDVLAEMKIRVQLQIQCII